MACSLPKSKRGRTRKKHGSYQKGRILVPTKSNRPSVQALSTGQAARFCFVTPETILNWIRSNRLKAQRTAGGQYRVPLQDLRSFMIENGMDTALLDAERDVRPYCWEFHCKLTSRYGNPSLEVCQDCLVHRSGTSNCWELHGLLPVTRRRFDACPDCEYYQTWRLSRVEGE